MEIALNLTTGQPCDHGEASFPGTLSPNEMKLDYSSNTVSAGMR